MGLFCHLSRVHSYLMDAGKFYSYEILNSSVPILVYHSHHICLYSYLYAAAIKPASSCIFLFTLLLSLVCLRLLT